MLAVAQDIIDKHGPDEGEEQTAAAREAAREAAEAAAAVETVANEPTAVAPSGYNSDSTDEGAEEPGEDVEGIAEAGKGGEQGAVVAQQAAVGGAGGGGGSEFAFSFFDGNATEAARLPEMAVEQPPKKQSGSDSSSSSSSSDDSDDSDEEEVGGNGGVSVGASTPATKKPRKARSALTGQLKAEAKAKAAAVAYERALQVAEVLS